MTEWISEGAPESLTFGEFRRQAAFHASRLHDEGVRAGDRVVIVMPQGIAAMAEFAGAMILGAVPAFLAYPNSKVEPSKYRSGLAGVTSNLHSRFVVVDREFPEEMLDYVSGSGDAKLIRTGVSTGSIEEEEFPNLANRRSQVAFIQHSAGTTGLQKGVALTHQAVLTQIGHLQEALQIDGGSDRIYSWLPLYHDMGLIACFMLPMVCHVPLVMQSPMDWVMRPGTMLQVISQYKCTLAWIPNFAFQFVPRRTRLDRMEQRPDLSSLRALINCSEPVRAGGMREFQSAFAGIGFRPTALQTSYAMAENVFAVTQSNIHIGPVRIWADGQEFRRSHRIVQVADDAPHSICFVSSGQLLRNHEIRIVSDSGAEAESGSVGEILVRSDCLFAGYYNRPDLSAQVLADGWYRTGDLGFYRDRELFVVGRKKDLIIVGGENIYPQDIEEIVAGHPAIHDGRAVAMGAYNPETGTEDIILIAEVENEDFLAVSPKIEQELRTQVVAAMGVAIGLIYLKPPKWIVKSTAGKPARVATFEKLLQEHPELAAEN